MRFTTSYHTQFPQYLRSRFPHARSGPRTRALRRFHGAAAALHGEHRPGASGALARAGSATWYAGAAASTRELFRPRRKEFLDLPRPIAAYVGRVAIEKNIDAFLQMPWRARKIVIGDGPERGAPAGAVPGGHVRRLSLRRGSGRAPGGRRRHGVPEPHRHLRARESRGDGLRSAGGRLSRHRPDRCDRGRRHWRPGRGSGVARRCARLSIDPRACRERALRSGGMSARASSRATWSIAYRARRRAERPAVHSAAPSILSHSAMVTPKFAVIICRGYRASAHGNPTA